MIVHLTSEVAPYYKRGGLGDVVGALPKYLSGKYGNAVISLYYEGRMKVDEIRLAGTYTIEIQHVEYEILYYYHKSDGVDFYFLNLSDRHLFSDMESGESDLLPEDGEKPYRGSPSSIVYLYFAKAALQLIANLNWSPEFLIFHDWQVCGCFGFPGLLKKIDPNGSCSTILLIHNYGYQGEILPDLLPLLDDEVRKELLPVFERFRTANFLALGLKNADYVATVSAKYARELTSGRAPHAGLKYLSAIKRQKIFALPNGIDLAAWSPATSPFIPRQYDRLSVSDGKRLAKAELECEMDLPRSADPIVLMMARLTEQKGLNIFMSLWEDEERTIRNIGSLLSKGIRFIICGRPSGGPKGDIHKRLCLAQEIFGDKFRYIPNYSDKMAHRLLAAADVILCPSVYEPCGLVQLYGMAFGTVPVVRPVGGLFDTVIANRDDPERSTGFHIGEFSHDSLLLVIEEVVDVFRRRPDIWSGIMRRCMDEDYSWEKIVTHYYNFFNAIQKEKAPERIELNYFQ